MTQALQIGVAGLGVVGGGFVRLLRRRADSLERQIGRPIALSAVAARSLGDRGLPLGGAAFYKDAAKLAAEADIDVFVELIGGADGVALQAVRAALSRGVPVITANKAMLAAHGLELAALAESNGVALAFEAAVAGGVPIIKTLRESLAGNEIRRVSGILNGTCNYILSRMESERLPFAVCLAEAQKLGYAEADPTFDIGGFDTAHKLALLSSLAFGMRVDADAVSIEGIETITLADLEAAGELGYRVKLLGVAERTPHGVEQRVHPTMVPRSAPLAQTSGVLNAVTIDADAVGSLTLVGPGAGAEATASSVASDLVDVALKRAAPTFGVSVKKLLPAERVPMQHHEGGYYVRLSVLDRPGAIAAIATRMAEHGISLEAISQKTGGRREEGELIASVVINTKATSEAAIRAALDETVADGVVRARPQLIRIERE